MRISILILVVTGFQFINNSKLVHQLYKNAMKDNMESRHMEKRCKALREKETRKNLASFDEIGSSSKASNS